MRKTLNRQQLLELFDEWGATGKYESDLESVEYRGYKVIAETVGEYFTENRETVKIVDVAAGTGLVGIKLQELGFKIMDWVDPSKGMMKTAESRNIYDKYFTEYVGENKLPIDTDRYDCCVCAGGFGEGFMPVNALFDMTRIVKPGGLVIFNVIKSNLQTTDELRDRLMPLIDTFVADNIWKTMRRETLPNQIAGSDGYLMVYKVLVSEITTVPQLPPLK
ncbi:hypothetical protein SNE40_015788 [Patella caerulea]|uniref:Methyltransferase domain-containing protein n=1 Tax=Patella caerulea TaxID=87958 RepID=A0AAN8JIQ2_PATCE